MDSDKVIDMESKKKDTNKEFDADRYVKEGIRSEIRDTQLDSLRMDDYVEIFKVCFEARNLTGKLDQNDTAIRRAFHKEIVEPFIKKYVYFCNRYNFTPVEVDISYGGIIAKNLALKDMLDDGLMGLLGKLS